MTTVKEARGEVRGWINNPLRSKWVKAKTMEAADAYGAARELKGHVEACEAVPPDGVPVYHCGDGWLCDVGREIKELGR